MNQTNENNEADEIADVPSDLERELQAMVPHGLSPTVRQTIGEQLTASPPRRDVSAMFSIAIAVAASILLLIGWLALRTNHPADRLMTQSDRNAIEQMDAVRTQIGSPEIAAVDFDPVPSFWNYRAAANKSLVELDQMLAQHGRRSMGGNTPLVLNEMDPTEI